MKRNGFGLVALVAALASTGCSKEAICPADETAVNGTCYALRSDPFHCGAVGHACGADQGCSAGVCVDCTVAGTACVPAVVAACYNLNQVRLLGANLAPATAPLDTDSGPIHFAQLDGKLYVANSTSSTISAITVAPPSATSGPDAIAVSTGNAGFADLEYLAAHGGLLWAANAATSTLVVLDPGTKQPVAELPLPAGGAFGPNPQGIDFVGDKGYVALAGMNAVGVIDNASTLPGAAVRATTIDLGSLAAPGATALPSRVLAVGSRVYVTLNDLDSFYQPVSGANGRLVVIDASTDAVVGTAVDLGAGCLNASGMALSGTTLWVACGFHPYNSADVSGGALLPVELDSGTPIAGTPIVLSNAASSIAFCNGRGYAGATESGTVIAFDPVSRTVADTALACPAASGRASAVLDLACAP